MPDAENDAPRVVTRTVTETWEPVTGPRPCQCGHVHYGRTRHSNEAPQWHICEADCGCVGLRPIPPGTTEANDG